MVYGPVTSAQNLTKGEFLTDLIKGNLAIFHLFEPAGIKGASQLHIKKVVHAYYNLFKSLDAGTRESGSCEKDVVCYPDWLEESNAVALVLLSSGSAWCSGSLLNNTAQDRRAFFLTAFHCIDDNQDGILQSSEISAAGNWAFRFRYRTTICSGTTVESYFTYNHDNFRAAWHTTDFALVELVNSPLYDPRVAFLGWDRSGATPTKGTGIHHPEGDVMKISFDNDKLKETSYLKNNGSNFWRVDWGGYSDIGATEPGSSGSPLFDQNKRVVGQLYGGYSACGNSDMRDWYGCLYRSWTGGGTNSTRLSNWLVPNGLSVGYFNMLYPWISGPSNVCSTNSTFTLHMVPPGSTVSWSVSPSVRVSPSSGTGTNATFHSITCSNIGNTIITYTITNSLGTNQVSKEFVVSGPDPQDVELDIYKSTGGHANKYGGKWVLCPNSTYYIYLINNSSCSTSNYTWILPSSLTKNYQNDNMISVNTNSSPGGNIIVIAQTCCTDCGSNVQILSDYVGTDYNCGYGYMSFAPNPASDEVTLELNTENMAGYKAGAIWSLEIYNQQQVLVKTMDNLTDTRQVIHTSGLKAGVYYVRVMIGNNMYSGKFVIER